MTKTILTAVLLVLPTLLHGQPLQRLEPFRDRTPPAPSEHTPLPEGVHLSMRDFAYPEAPSSSIGPIRWMQTQPGAALLGSALLPGLGQAANGKWIRAGAYLIAEVLFLGLHIHNQQRAEELQRSYEQFANENWSVVTYAQWLVTYHDENGIANDALGALRNQVAGIKPAYDTNSDWPAVNLELLRDVERNTPFVNSDGTRTNIFSHQLPTYGSQQYYELISKYFQFGPGWRDFGVNREGIPLDNPYRLAWNGEDMPPLFLEGARRADRFNDKYRIAGNMLSYMILNHVISAFDAFISVKLKQNRLQAESNIFPGRQFILKYHF